jgi:hypothetical protein
MELLKRVNMLKMVFTPRRGLRGPTSRVLQKWDEIASRRNIAGIGSADVHAHAYRKGPIKMTIFPYKVQFRSIRTHLLLREPLSSDIESAKMQIFEAIRNCRVFVSNYRWGDARGFQFLARSADSSFHPGDCASLSDNLTLLVRAPRIAELKIIRNGSCIHESLGDKTEFKVADTGIYRVELHRNGRGWIYSNHIKVT